jgi:tetratricopeptide (TPR) repeat protein
VDRERQCAEIDGLLDAIASAPADVTGPARVGAAKPDIAPPVRVGAARSAAPPLTANYIPPFVEGIKAVRRGDMRQAITLQREAHARRLAAGDTAGALEMEILLAVYQGQLALASRENTRPALETFERAIRAANDAGLVDVASRAGLLEGVLANAAGDAPGAVRTLQRAASLAETAGAHALQAEALRLSADLVSRAGLNDRAAQFRADAARAAARARPPAAAGGSDSGEAS